MHCPTCGQEIVDDGGSHLVHDQSCKDTLCKLCDHCEFSSGLLAKTCKCKKCNCFDINFFEKGTEV